MNHFDSKYLNFVVPPPISIDLETNAVSEQSSKQRKNGFKYKDIPEEQLAKIVTQIQSRKTDKISIGNDKKERKASECAVHGTRNSSLSHELEQQELKDVIPECLSYRGRSKLFLTVKDDKQHCEVQENIEQLPNYVSQYIPCAHHSSCQSNMGATTLETIQEEVTQSISEVDAESNISEDRFSINEKFNDALTTAPKNNNVTPFVPKLNLEGLNESPRDEFVLAAKPKSQSYNMPEYNIHERKIITLRKKIDTVLEHIVKEAIRVPEPDGVYDLLRRHKREAEFASRFSRNHLYQLRRQVLELNKQAKDTNVQTLRSIQRKIVIAHQHSLQALEIYHNQMSMLTLGGSLGKLVELLGYLTELTNVCIAMNMKCIAVPDAPCFEEKTKHLQKLLDTLTIERAAKPYKEPAKKVEHMTSIMTTTGRKTWENCLRSTESHPRTYKLAHSVYACSPHRQTKVNKSRKQGKQSVGRKKTGPFVAKAPSKLSSQAQVLRNLAQKSIYISPYAQSSGFPYFPSHPQRRISKEQKFQTAELSPNRYDLQPTELLDQHPESSSFLQPPKHKLQKVNINEVVNKVDENIETIVASIPCERENQEEDPNQKATKQGESLKMSNRVPEDAFLRSLSERIIEMCEERVREKIDVFMNDLVAEKKTQIKDREDGKQASTERKQVGEPMHETSASDGDLRSTSEEISAKALSGSKSEHSLTAAKSLKIGPKNAQLIYIEHSDQILDTNPLAMGDAGVQQQHHQWHYSGAAKPEHPHGTNELGVERDVTSNEASFGMEINSCGSSWSLQQRPDFVKLSLSKEKEMSALKYRKMFHHYMKTNPMYQESEQPWLMVEKLSDQMVEEVMQNMVEEVQMQFLADELYDLEFEKKKKGKHKY